MTTDGRSIPPYGAAIHSAIAEGNLSQMKQLLIDAEKTLEQHRDLPSAVVKLKKEIENLEKKA